jgi:hypothetical protein
MGRPRSRIPIVSRVMTAHETAAYIGVGDSKFGQMRKIGAFPVKPLPYGPYWDQRAVDRWFDVQAGLTDDDIGAAQDGAKKDEDAWIKAAQKWPG